MTKNWIWINHLQIKDKFMKRMYDDAEGDYDAMSASPLEVCIQHPENTD
jgi:hypothetical protein